MAEELPFPAPTLPTSTNNDPDEVDLSTHPSAAARTPNYNNVAPTEGDIRAILRSEAPPQLGANGPQQQEEEEEEEDPMMKMVQQLMGSIPGAERQGGDGGSGGLPPGLAAMLGAGGMGMGGQQEEKREDTYGYVWKIVHAIFAFCLGIYVTATSHAFNGDISRGGISGAGHEGGSNVFWVFATAELVLQSSRFFLEREGGSPLGGWIGIMGNMLPEPWRGWIKLAARYSGIWSTVVEDGMVVLFVVGCVAWWKGAVG